MRASTFFRIYLGDFTLKAYLIEFLIFLYIWEFNEKIRSFHIFLGTTENLLYNKVHDK